MGPREDTERNAFQGPGPSREGEQPTDRGAPESGPAVVASRDPAAPPGPARGADPPDRPEETMAVETDKIRGSNEACSPGYVIVPVEANRPRQDPSGPGKPPEVAKPEKGRSAPGDRHSEPADRHKERRGPPNHPPTPTRMLLYTGLVALVCGLVGAFGFSYFFGAGKSGDQKAAGEGKSADKSSDSADDSAEPKSSADDRGLHEAQAAWVSAMRELRQARSTAETARRSEERMKSVLDFLNNTLLSAGRPGGETLTKAFWAGGQGKDVTLRQAVDASESQVAGVFAERPLAEASVREILGQAYLSLAEPARAVKQYERAYALRQALQGFNHPDTASCRNQLAIAYRLAGLTSEGSRLFDSDPETPEYATAIAARGTMLLLQKQPAEAELKLRESLTIREKLQPDDWTTFETKSLLGEALLEQKKYAEAELLLLSGYQGMKQRERTIPPQDRSRLVRALERIIRLYEAQGDTQKAETWRKQYSSYGLYPQQDDLEPTAPPLTTKDKLNRTIQPTR